MYICEFSAVPNANKTSLSFETYHRQHQKSQQTQLARAAQILTDNPFNIEAPSLHSYITLPKLTTISVQARDVVCQNQTPSRSYHRQNSVGYRMCSKPTWCTIVSISRQIQERLAGRVPRCVAIAPTKPRNLGNANDNHHDSARMTACSTVSLARRNFPPLLEPQALLIPA